MTLETPRLLLRRFQPEDADALHAYLSDAEVVRFEPYKPFTPEESRQEALRRSGDEAFLAVCLREDGRLIGNIYLAGEAFDTYTLGYVFARCAWGHGYATEAACAAVAHVFQTGAHRVYALCNPENAASWRLLERLGLRREGHLRKNVYFTADPLPQWQDTYLYAVLREEWEENQPC